jgi:hypothetical protein
MSAIISACGKYRYRLERDVQMDGPTFAYFGVNPSTADSTLDDATVRKWIGFTKVNGGRQFIVGNVFAFRSTDVKALMHADDPIGPENRDHLMQIAADADVLVPCWGDTKKVTGPLRHAFGHLFVELVATGKPVKTFGLTAGGDPKHPLMLGYGTPLIDWRALSQRSAQEG